VSVPTKVTLSFKGGKGSDPYVNARFTGRVKPRGSAKARRACRANRTVVLRAGRKRVGKAKTNRRGRYALPARRLGRRDPYAQARRVKAVVSAKRVGRFFCKKASSRAVALP
jgi:hypothetical protein